MISLSQLRPGILFKTRDGYVFRLLESPDPRDDRSLRAVCVVYGRQPAGRVLANPFVTIRKSFLTSADNGAEICLCPRTEMTC